MSKAEELREELTTYPQGATNPKHIAEDICDTLGITREMVVKLNGIANMVSMMQGSSCNVYTTQEENIKAWDEPMGVLYLIEVADKFTTLLEVAGR